MFPETLNKPLPQTVGEVERMGVMGWVNESIHLTANFVYSLLPFISLRPKQPLSVIGEGEALTGKTEDDILKANLARADHDDDKL